MLKINRRFPLLLMLLVGACASIPSGPSMMVLPGAGKTFDQFREDDASCKQYAAEQVEGTPNRAAISSGATSAAIGTGIGAAAGAAFAGGTGAAIGAGSGLLLGGLMGTSTARTSGNTAQRRYDMSYIQCMYAKGHRVPISGRIADNPGSQAPQTTQMPSQPLSDNFPPPPPGNPPPPPP